MLDRDREWSFPCFTALRSVTLSRPQIYVEIFWNKMTGLGPIICLYIRDHLIGAWLLLGNERGPMYQRTYLLSCRSWLVPDLPVCRLRLSPAKQTQSVLPLG